MQRRLLRIRGHLRLSQKDIADKCDISRQTLAKFENGEKVSKYTQAKILAQIEILERQVERVLRNEH